MTTSAWWFRHPRTSRGLALAALLYFVALAMLTFVIGDDWRRAVIYSACATAAAGFFEWRRMRAGRPEAEGR